MAVVVETLARAVAIVGAASFSFFIGLIFWGTFVSSFLIDLVSIFGLTMSFADVAALGFIFGGALAVGVVMVVFD